MVHRTETGLLICSGSDYHLSLCFLFLLAQFGSSGVKELQGAEISTQGRICKTGGSCLGALFPGIITSHHIHPVISYFKKPSTQEASLWGPCGSHARPTIFVSFNVHYKKSIGPCHAVLRMPLATTTCQIKSSQSNKMSLEEIMGVYYYYLPVYWQ